MHFLIGVCTKRIYLRVFTTHQYLLRAPRALQDLLTSIHHSPISTQKHFFMRIKHLHMYICIVILIHSLCTWEQSAIYLQNVRRHAGDHECFFLFNCDLYILYFEVCGTHDHLDEFPRLIVNGSSTILSSIAIILISCISWFMY